MTLPSNPVNPSSTKRADAGERKRIPLSIARRKMEAQDIPGYRLYWFLDSNVPNAIQGGYEFVNADEMPLNQRGVGNDSTLTGNADLGTSVRVAAGMGEGGKPEFHTLMKIKEEWFKEDQKALEERNASMLRAIFKEEKILGDSAPGEQGTRYVKTALLNRPSRKG